MNLPAQENTKDASIADDHPGGDIPDMRTYPEARPTAFDPFGEPVTDGVARVCPEATGDRTARRVAGAVFWTLAVVILAGRVYAYDMPAVQNVAAHAVQMLALR
ncbi:hypothetical protein SAMN05216360_13410 [Methylobacterium phyllostachyos]|uniref:Uncharacterized protein n=1 Tax=Methylobacterium phyllostachyos TaxID=582672 RepID=A0A1H0LDX7_9HYPH|nr:hypothetical protein [Methylobacterium phyllostachyos]SDO66236.1 hypothetical protein SAMN05216360_13410 [Methylobacterium phyllostachyos]